MTTSMTLNPQDGILVYTDGSASVKSKTGGWAYIALDSGDGEHSDSGGEENTTIGRMELLAPIKALSYLIWNGVKRVLVISDSEYVVKGFMEPHRARNKNQDLWRELTEVSDMFNCVVFEHTPGHSGDYFNERVDKLAVAARKAVVVKSNPEREKG